MIALNPVIAFVCSWLVFLVVEFKEKKKVVFKFTHSDVFGLILIFFTTFFLAFNTFNADYENYGRIYADYLNESTTGSNFVFGLICGLGNLLKLDYQTFRCFLICFAVFSVFHFSRRYSKNVAFMIFLYMISGFIMDGIQFRQFTAMGVYLLFLPYLLQDDSKKGKILYIIGTLIATGIHTLFVFFFIFLLVKVKKENRIKISVAVTLAVIVLFWILDKVGLLIKYLSYVMPEEKVDLYFLGTQYHSSPKLVIQFILLQQVLILVLLLVCYKIGKVRECDKAFIWLVIGIDILMLCMCPILFYTLQFRRIFRVVMIPSFIAIYKMSPDKKDARFIFIVIALIAFSLISLNLNLTGNSDLIGNLVLNNYFW